MQHPRLLVRTLTLAAAIAVAPLVHALGAQAIAPAGAIRHARVADAADDTTRRPRPLTVNAARASGAVLGSAAGIIAAIGTVAACRPVFGRDPCIPAGLVVGSAAVGLIVSEATASAGVPRARRATIVGALAGLGLLGTLYAVERTKYPDSDMSGYTLIFLSPVIPIAAIVGNVIGVERAR